MGLAYAAVAAIGLLAAVGEIWSRYRDEPWDALSSRAAVLYMAFNVAISILAFYLLREVFPLRDTNQDTLPNIVTDVGLAGVSAMAFFRSSIFMARVGDKDVPVGPAALIEIFRSVLDRDVDRVRAKPRADSVAKIMENVSFSRAYVPLTSTALNLLQNVGPEERSRVQEKVLALANQTGRNEESKALELGLILAGTVGFKVLESARDSLKNHIMTGTSRTDLVKKAVQTLGPKVGLTQLPKTCLALDSNLPDEAQHAMAEELAGNAEQDDPIHIKAVHAGFVLTHYLGEQVFESAVDLLHDLNADPNAGD